MQINFVLQEKIMLRAKVVVALYPFRAIEGGDLSLEKVKTKRNNKYCEERKSSSKLLEYIMSHIKYIKLDRIFTASVSRVQSMRSWTTPKSTGGKLRMRMGT